MTILSLPDYLQDDVLLDYEFQQDNDIIPDRTVLAHHYAPDEALICDDGEIYIHAHGLKITIPLKLIELAREKILNL